MNQDLVRYDKDANQRVQTFLTEGDSKNDALRFRAIKAANTKDFLELWSMTESYLLTHGRKRTSTSKHTLKAYRASIKKLVLEFWTDTNLLNPTGNNVLSLVNKIEQRYSVSSQRIHLSAYKMLYKMLRFADATEVIPFADIMIQTDTDNPNDKREAYTTEDVLKLLEAADTEQSLVIVLSAFVGLRNIEIAKLEWKHVNVIPSTDTAKANRQEVTVKHGKGSKTRKPPILSGIPLDLLTRAKQPGHVIESVQHLKTDSRKSDTIRDMVKTVCILSGVDYKGIHSFRHHCGTFLAELGYTADDIRDFLGHASSSTTEKFYIKGKRLDKFKDVKV